MSKFKVGDIIIRTGKNYGSVKTGEKYIVARAKIYSEAIYLENDDDIVYDGRFFEKVSIKSFQNLKII
jgi:uncharacterized protein YciI